MTGPYSALAVECLGEPEGEGGLADVIRAGEEVGVRRRLAGEAALEGGEGAGVTDERRHGAFARRSDRATWAVADSVNAPPRFLRVHCRSVCRCRLAQNDNPPRHSALLHRPDVGLQ